MSSTVGDEGQGGRFGAKDVRTCRLSLGAIFVICCLLLELKFPCAAMGQKLETWPNDWK